MTVVDEGLEGNADDGAAYWFARLRADPLPASERAAFLRWINAAPGHEAAFRRVQQVWQDLGEIAGDDSVSGMRREAIACAPPRSKAGWVHFGAIAATLVLLVVASLLFLGRSPIGPAPAEVQVATVEAPTLYRTAIGDRSAVTLDDGSHVELNTDTVIQVDFSRNRRDVRLLRGQALFDVAHDATRPFIVEAAGQQVTAVGTAFDVRVDQGEMRVTLIEGKVAVSPVRSAAQAGPAPVKMLNPGQQLVAAAEQPVLVRPADVDQTTSWRSGRVIFEDEPLAEVVEEVNRYSDRKIVLADTAAGRIRVSGVFRAGSVGTFVTALDAAFPIAAEQRAEGILLRSE